MRRVRINLFIVTSLLIAIGMVMIYSASYAFAYENFADSAYFLKKHLVFLLVALAATVSFMVVDYGRLRPYIKPFLLVSIVLLVCVFIPGVGRSAGGARRWIQLGWINFQPSEIAKIQAEVDEKCQKYGF